MPMLQVDSATELGFAQLLRLALKRLAVDYEKETDRQLWMDEDPARLHTQFLQLHRELKGVFPALARIHFSERGPFPYSRDVSEALEILQQSGAINRENPNYTRFSPRVFEDTEATVHGEIERLFPPGTAERTGFDRLVEGLRPLISDE